MASGQGTDDASAVTLGSDARAAQGRRVNIVTIMARGVTPAPAPDPILGAMMTGPRPPAAGARTRAAGARSLRAGFTILDVLMTVVILGVLTAVATPRFGRTIASSKVNRAIFAVSGELELAGTLAARQRKPVRVAYDATSGELRVTDRASGAVLRSLPLGTRSDYGLSAVTLSAAAVDVFPNGITSGPLTVSLTGAGHTRQATMSRAGYVRVVR